MAANFVQTQIVKTSERKSTVAIADVSTFSGVVSDLITNKPGADSAEISSEYYTAKFVIYDVELNKLGEVSVKVPSAAGYTQAITEIITNGALNAVATACAEGATVERNQSDDIFYSKVKLTQTEENGGESYYVAFDRQITKLTSYESDEVLSAVETWADTQTALA